MKNHIAVLVLVLLVMSCSKDRTPEDELLGTWNYQREFYSANITSPTRDTLGSMTFDEDEKGVWLSESEFQPKVFIEWDFQSNGKKLAITRLNTFASLYYDKTKIYEITKDGEDLLTLSFPYSDPKMDTLNYIESFEIITLRRN